MPQREAEPQEQCVTRRSLVTSKNWKLTPAGSPFMGASPRSQIGQTKELVRLGCDPLKRGVVDTNKSADRTRLSADRNSNLLCHQAFDQLAAIDDLDGAAARSHDLLVGNDSHQVVHRRR
jgi:hypothetical protein